MTASPALASALQANLTALDQGVRLLAKLDRGCYAKRLPLFSNASIGAHLRHIIDHYHAFLRGLEQGELNYENRARHRALEEDPCHASRTLETVALQITTEVRAVADRPLRYRAETSTAASTSTSMLRELEFLLSHTIHHYALISALARTQGYELESDFGIAPSTLRYHSGPPPCAPSPG